MVVCSALGLTAELIGPNIQSAAFVYGLMSLGDKVFNGLAVIFIENLNTCPQEQVGHQCTSGECDFYGLFISFGIAGILLVGCTFVLLQGYFITGGGKDGKGKKELMGK